jgi:predicted dehydrogenase/aryl-alcohol dehydrogenase-like predicted oxidoreductase
VNKLRWGILSTGYIAKAFARGVQHSKTGELIAVGSRAQDSAEAFGAEFNIPHRHGSYEALLADPDVDAVYISPPHPFHVEWAIKAAEAGKHVLCEKPLALNTPQAMAVIEAALRCDVFLMEAFMYRCHPQTARLVELIRDKAIGDLRFIQATFSFNFPFQPGHRLLANELGGGGILDVGCYPVSMSRLIAGVAIGKDFDDPIEVKGAGKLNSITGTDEYAAATLKFSSGIVAQVACGVQVAQENVVRIYGTHDYIVVPDPWIPSREGGATKIVLHRQSEVQEVTIETNEWLYGIEADTVAAHIEQRQAPSPAMSWDDTLGNMRTLDEWRKSIRLVYNSEKADAPEMKVTAARRPLRSSRRAEEQVSGGEAVAHPLLRTSAPMRYGPIDGVNKPISRLIMGVDNQETIAHASVMLDDFFERGGNTFDTAHIYLGGRAEPILGQWVKNRNIREQIVILDKGAHTPFCTPEFLTQQLLISLDRLQMDYVDIYMMHRDNPQVPVGEFIDVLNEHLNAGRMRAFGGSNWSIERVEAANAYARAKGLRGFSAISNNFSLARMIEPPWAGCLSASTPEFRAWLTKTQLPLMPWSSQARGFFLPHATPDNRSDPELVRCWYSEDNFERQRRARELAQKYGVLPINIALAYVLNQPFPTFPLIGPRTLAETRTSLPALDVPLTPEEVKWLNLEE